MPALVVSGGPMICLREILYWPVSGCPLAVGYPPTFLEYGPVLPLNFQGAVDSALYYLFG